MDQFESEAQKVKGIQEETMLVALSSGLKPTFFAGDLVRIEAPEHIRGGNGTIPWGAQHGRVPGVKNTGTQTASEELEECASNKGGGTQQLKTPKAEHGSVEKPHAPEGGFREFSPALATNQRQVFLTLGGIENLLVAWPMQ